MKKPKRKAPTSKKAHVLDNLKPDEAATVLRVFLEKHPDLRKEVEALVKSIIGDVSIEDVADEVEDAVRSLDLDDLSSRAGRHRNGYVEPSQAAVDLVEEAVMPFIGTSSGAQRRGSRLRPWPPVWESSSGSTACGTGMEIRSWDGRRNHQTRWRARQSSPFVRPCAKPRLPGAALRAPRVSLLFSARLRLSGSRCWSAAGAAHHEGSRDENLKTT